MKAASPASALSIRGLWKSFGALDVLQGIDLEVAEHEVIALIGASGSGKSTLLRCINLLEPIDEGRIFIEGQEITARDVNVDRIRRRVGIVFQSFNLFPHMRVLDNVTLGPRKVLQRTKAGAEADAMRLLERFGLAEKANQLPDRLSGGQQQRVAIVRALAMQPDLLLLDEVTSALDPELVAEVLNVVRELAAGGMTMLIATHEMGFARDIASRVCFLDAGRILEQGPPAQIFAQPREPRTRQFLNRIIEAGRLYFVILSLGLVGISLPVVLFPAIASSLLTSLPGTPAGLGFVESVIIGILLISSNLGLVTGVDQSLATSVAILDRTISYWSLVIFGLGVYLVSKKK